MWGEFTISLMNVIQIDDETVKMEDSGTRSKASVKLSTIVRFYASKTDNDQNVVLLTFDDGDQLVVWESWKQVKEIMKPITDANS